MTVVNNFLWRLIATTGVRNCLNWWSFSTGRSTGTFCLAMFPESSQCSKRLSLPFSCKGECEWELSVLTNQKIQILALAQAPKERKSWHNLFALWSDRSLGQALSTFFNVPHYVRMRNILMMMYFPSVFCLWTNDNKKVVFRSSKKFSELCWGKYNITRPRCLLSSKYWAPDLWDYGIHLLVVIRQRQLSTGSPQNSVGFPVGEIQRIDTKEIRSELL